MGASVQFPLQHHVPRREAPACQDGLVRVPEGAAEDKLLRQCTPQARPLSALLEFALRAFTPHGRISARACSRKPALLGGWTNPAALSAQVDFMSASMSPEMVKGADEIKEKLGELIGKTGDEAIKVADELANLIDKAGVRALTECGVIEKVKAMLEDRSTAEGGLHFIKVRLAPWRDDLWCAGRDAS